MADNYPRVTDEQLKAADRDREKQALESAGVGGAVGFGFYKLNAPLGFVGRFFQKGFTNLDIRKAPSGEPPAVVRLRPLGFLAFFIPQPVGLVPAEYYGLHPNVIKNTLGFRVGKKPPFLTADESRVREFEARQFSESIIVNAIGGEARGFHGAIPDSSLRSGLARVTPEEFDYLRSLQPGVSPLAERFVGQGLAHPHLIGTAFRPHGPSGVPQPPARDDHGHLVRLNLPGGKKVEAVETRQGNLIRINASGRALA